MIPAILTCEFVIWLYASLTPPEASSQQADRTTGVSPAADSATEQLASRLAALEARITALTDAAIQGGPRS